MKDILNEVELRSGGTTTLSSPVAPSSKKQTLALYRRFFKRVFDLAFALALLPILVPTIAVLWALTRRAGQSGFYVQDRVGLNGRVFKCYKIRSMIVDAERVLEELCQNDARVAEEWHKNQKLSKDPRITRIGGFLRATSLDELPQIWNVLLGDMSFVGPRPFMVEQEDLYRAAGGEAYFALRPGITGLWQIDGRGTTSFVGRVSYDNKYALHMTFLGDLKLMMSTVQVVFDRTGH
jgi:lipopolysaccharide/colanic/teichoic acid biosynthesis glycosyltransferase